jgi:hypothetical protein
MTEDDVLRQVRAARESYARAHNFDVRAMVADLQARDQAGDQPVVRRPPRRPAGVTPPNKVLRQPTGAA